MGVVYVATAADCDDAALCRATLSDCGKTGREPESANAKAARSAAPAHKEAAVFSSSRESFVMWRNSFIMLLAPRAQGINLGFERAYLRLLFFNRLNKQRYKLGIIHRKVAACIGTHRLGQNTLHLLRDYADIRLPGAIARLPVKVDAAQLHNFCKSVFYRRNVVLEPLVG